MQELNSHDVESTVFSLSPVFQKTVYGHRLAFLFSAGYCVALTELNSFSFACIELWCNLFTFCTLRLCANINFPSPFLSVCC